MRSIQISAGNSYTVTVGSGLLERCGELLKSVVGVCRALIITDGNVGPLYAGAVEKSIKQAGFEVSVFTFEPGEKNKTMQTLSQALEFMAGEQMTRTDCVVALGGGVVGDLAGLAAGCFLRGIRYVQLPTTLLAAVDSSVGGKTAVDLPAGKNLAGLFWQPSAVICDTDCLNTLPEPVFLDGVAEAVKTGVLEGEELFSLLESGKLADNIEDIIARCVAFKARVVGSDERETGLRKTLNLGHTIGHAIETCSGYSISHGSAVSAGIAMITRSAAAMGYCDKQDARRIVKLLEERGLPTETEFSTHELAQAANQDKKRAGSRITLVLPRRIGVCELRDKSIDELPGFIDEGRRDMRL